MNKIEFEVHNQTIVRVDSKEIISRNKHLYKAIFTFEEDSEWVGLNKFVIFTDGWGNTTTQHIGKNGTVLSCLIPDKVLSGSYFKVSVYAGDLITTNNVTVSLIQSGYRRQPSHHHHHHHSCDDYQGKDIFVEIFEQLDETVDSIVYDNKTLQLFHRDDIVDSVYLPFLTDEEIRELVDNLTIDFIDIPVATHEKDGLLSHEDKMKLDSVEHEANHTIVDNELDTDSDNPVANRVIKNNFDSLNSQVNDLTMTVNDLDLDEINNTLDEHTTHMGVLDESLESIRVNLNGKEDSYDYVERLDNIIVTLINKGENQ